MQKVPKIIDAWCPINAKVGETVGIEYQEMNKTKSKIIVYGFPVLAVLAGAVFGNSLSIFFGIDKALPMILGVVVWLLIALNYVRIFKRDAMREGEQPVVVEIEPMGPIIMDDPLKKPEE